NEFKREVAGRGNRGTQADEIAQYGFSPFILSVEAEGKSTILKRHSHSYLSQSCHGSAMETEVVIEGEKTIDFDIPVNKEEKTNEKKENAATEPEEKDHELISFSSYEVLFWLKMFLVHLRA
ncbi:hypothetical protein Tco_1297060, partial [Tanacetum coccineum]